VKREIMANGPVLGQISPFTDFLSYSMGYYQRTAEAFKYNGSHVVKVLGWEKTPDGATAWIIENSWGPTWGNKGFGEVISNGETQLDYYAIGLAVYPTSMAEYYAS
jgi:cathepsin B